MFLNFCILICNTLKSFAMSKKVHELKCDYLKIQIWTENNFWKLDKQTKTFMNLFITLWKVGGYAKKFRDLNTIIYNFELNL